MHVAIYNIVCMYIDCMGNKIANKYIIMSWTKHSHSINMKFDEEKWFFFTVKNFKLTKEKRKVQKMGEENRRMLVFFFCLKLPVLFSFFDRIRFDSIDFVRVSSGVHYERDMQNAWLLSGCALTWICLNSTHACMEDSVKSTQLQLCKTFTVCGCAHGSLTLSLSLFCSCSSLLFIFEFYIFWQEHIYLLETCWLWLEIIFIKGSHTIFLFICRRRTLLSIPHMHQISSNI